MKPETPEKIQGLQEKLQQTHEIKTGFVKNEFQRILLYNVNYKCHEGIWKALSDDNQNNIIKWFCDKNPNAELIFVGIQPSEQFIDFLTYIRTSGLLTPKTNGSHALSGGSRRRRRPSRKYKKSKRVFRKKSRSTRRR